MSCTDDTESGHKPWDASAAWDCFVAMVLVFAGVVGGAWGIYVFVAEEL